MEILLIVIIGAIPFTVVILGWAFVTERYFMTICTALALAGFVFILNAYKDELTKPIGTGKSEVTVTAPAVTTTVQPQRTVTTTPTVTVTHATSPHNSATHDATEKE